MFDIGGPEFLVIAIIALVVLGPERLPDVMRRAGLFYRQAREMLNQYTSEAQRMFDEGMREVEEVSNTISNTWQEATADPTKPPPALLQVPAPLLPPETAAAAGPWMLPSWYRDSRADVEPQAQDYPTGPFALPRARPVDEWFDDLNVGGPSLMGAAPLEDEPVEPVQLVIEPAAPKDERPPMEAGPEPARTPAARPYGGPAPDRIDLMEPELVDEPMVHATPSNGALYGRPEVATDPGTVRQETLIALYRTGDITLEKAAEFLGISQAEFRALLKRK